MMAGKRGPYKRYNTDEEAMIPRSTRQRLDKTASAAEALDKPTSADSDVQQSTDDAESFSLLPPDEVFDELCVNDPDTCEDESNVAFDHISDISNDDSHTDTSHENGDDVNHEKVFEGSNVSVMEAISLILSFFLKHSLTRECLCDLLLLLSVLLPTANNIPNTKYKLMKIVDSFCSDVKRVIHYYCPNCQSYLGQKLKSVCPICNYSFDEFVAKQSIFVEFPIDCMLRSLLENQEIYKYFMPASDGDGNVKDMNDGEMYKHTTKDHGTYDFSLLWNADGISVFKSSTAQLWPLHFLITNLPPYLRRKYLLVTGLWNGKVKPFMNTFLQPFCKSLQKLAVDGFTWTHPKTGQCMRSKVIAPVATVDAPARCILQNIHQYNGEFGCSACEHPGITHFLETGGKKWVYLPGEKYPERNSERMNEQATDAVETNTIVKGVKGPAFISLLPHFDSGYGFVPDYMHCVLLGVIRSLTMLWLDSTNHVEPWYLGRTIEEIDQRLLKVKVPSNMTRVPRSVEQRKYWKASEWRAWLLFYSLPVLNDLLPSKYLQHLILLVQGIYILLQDNIQPVYIELASTLLDLFVEHIPTLYGVAFCSFNIHQLTHLASAVKRWGPLWAHSAFLFENNNGELLRMIHGTQAIDKQIAHLFSLNFTLSVMSNKITESSECFIFLQHLIGKQIKKRFLQVGNVKLLGKGVSRLRKNVHRSVQLASGNNCDDGIQYLRMIYNNVVFLSESYTRCRKRNGQTIMFRSQNFERYGSVFSYVLTENRVFAVVYVLEIDDDNGAFLNRETSASTHFIRKILSKRETVIAVPVADITCLCVRVLNYICIPPNQWEKNL